MEKLAGAILLRRFFDPATEAGVAGAPFASEAVNVIASILRAQDSGNFQKLLADGLGYAPTLRRADLQRTNLRNAYLGTRKRRAARRPGLLQSLRASWLAYPGDVRRVRQVLSDARSNNDDEEVTIDLSHADFYRADLSNASLKGAQADDAVFYQARMHNTILKSAKLRRANFFEADLRGAVFQGALLSGADFKGARNLPPELINRLDKERRYIGEDPFAEASTSIQAETPTKVFLSKPGCLNQVRKGLITSIGAWLEAEDMVPVSLERPDYPLIGALGEIQRLMKECAGAVVFGFGEFEVQDGVWRADTTESCHVKEGKLSTPWSQLVH